MLVSLPAVDTNLTENGHPGYVTVANRDDMAVGSVVSLVSTVLTQNNLKVIRLDGRNVYLWDPTAQVAFDASAFLTADGAHLVQDAQDLFMGAVRDFFLDPNDEQTPLATSELAKILADIVPVYRTLRDASTGHMANVSPSSELLVQAPYRIAGAGFTTGTLDISYWMQTVTGSGAVNVVDSQANLVTGTTANSSVSLVSTQRARHVSGYSVRFHSILRLPDGGTPNNTRRWGVFDEATGYGFVLNSVGRIGVFSLKGGVYTDKFDGLNGVLGASSPYPDVNAHHYDIIFNPQGAFFEYDHQILHQMVATTVQLIGDYDLPMSFMNANSNGGTANVSMEVWTAAVLRLGLREVAPHWKHLSGATTGVYKRGPGSLRRVAVNALGDTIDTMTIYDGVDGTGQVIAVISFGTGQKGVVMPVTIDYSLDFDRGLYIVTTGTTDFTVMFD